MSVALTRAFEIPVATVPGMFVDVDPRTEYAPSVDALAEAAVTRGCSADPARYCPTRTIDRAGAASMLQRARTVSDRRAIARIGPSQDSLGSDVPADTQCDPSGPCSGALVPRWVMAVWLVRIVDGTDPVDAGVSRFADVEPAMWWAPHVERLAELRITVGCSREGPLFCPFLAVSRAQMASFIARMFRTPVAGGRSGLGDVSLDSTHAAAIDAVLAKGIVEQCRREQGFDYCPLDPVSRVEVSGSLDRALAGYRRQN